MSENLQKKVKKYSKNHRQKRRWRKAFTVLALITAFCTTYALMTPAITIDDNIAGNGDVSKESVYSDWNKDSGQKDTAAEENKTPDSGEPEQGAAPAGNDENANEENGSPENTEKAAEEKVLPGDDFESCYDINSEASNGLPLTTHSAQCYMDEMEKILDETKDISEAEEESQKEVTEEENKEASEEVTEEENKETSEEVTEEENKETTEEATEEEKEEAAEEVTEEVVEEVTEEACTISKTTEDGVTVTIQGELPENSEIQLTKLSKKVLAAIVNEAGGDTPVFGYDITIIDGEENIWQPDELGAKVTISGLTIPKGELEVVHVPDEGEPEKVEVRQEEDTVQFTAEGFSVYVGYIVEFHYGDLTFCIAGESEILLSDIFKQLEIKEDIADVEKVEFSNTKLVSVEQVDGDWKLTSLESFNTPETLTVTFKNGNELEISVTDPEGRPLNSGTGLRVSYITSADPKWYLSGDMEGTASLTIQSGDITIDLNGHYWSVNPGSGGQRTITVNSGATLTIIDSNPTTVHKGKISDYGTWYYPSTNGTVPIYGGVLCTSNGSAAFNIVVQSGATLNFNAGTLAGCWSNTYAAITSTKSAPIYVEGGTVNMNGGSIKYCYSNKNSGGIYVKGGGTVNMTAGSITNCKGGAAGAVNVENGTFTINGNAYIDDCTCLTSGSSGRMAYANGSNAVIDVKGEAYIGNCNTVTGNGGNAVAANSGKVNVFMIPTFTYTMKGRNIPTSVVFNELQGQTSEDGQTTFNYSHSNLSGVTPKDSGITYSDGKINASEIFSGTKKAVVTMSNSDKFLLKLSIEISSKDYVMTGRSDLLSNMLNGTGKSVSDVARVDVGSSGFTATDTGSDWEISTASVFSGTKTISAVFNDGSELQLNLSLNIPSKDYTMSGRSGLLSDMLNGTGKGYADVDRVDVGSSGFTATDTGSDWRISTDSIFEGSKPILVVYNDSTELQINISLNIQMKDYSVNGRNTKLSTILAAIGSSKTAADITSIDVGGDADLTAQQITGDWNIHVNKTASQLSEEWEWEVTNLFDGSKTVAVTFNDNSELYLNLKSNDLINYLGQQAYYFSCHDDSVDIQEVLDTIGVTAHTAADVVNVESTENAYIGTLHSPDWQITPVQRFAGSNWVWVLIEFSDGREIVVNVHAPKIGSVYFSNIPNIQTNGYYINLGNGWTHSGSNRYWFYRSMESYYGQISYCIQPDWPQREWDEYTQYTEAEDFWANIFDNKTGLDTDTIKKLLGRVLYEGYDSDISYKWRYEESKDDPVMAQNMADAIATQMLVWECIVGQRDASFNHIYPSGADSLLDCLNDDGKIYDKIVESYYRIEAAVQAMKKLPSFMSDNSSAPPTSRMNKVGDHYELTLTDTNNVLDQYNITSDKNDVTLTVNGNQLTISSPTKYSSILLTAEPKIGTWRYGTIVFHSSGRQDTATFGEPVEDKINGYAKAVNVQTGDLSVEKALGTGTDTTKQYDFKLTIEDTTGYADFTDSGYMQDAVYTGATISSQTKNKIVFTFKLKGGDKIDFKNFVPEKAKISLVETSHKNCNVVMKYNGTQIGTDSGSITNFSTAGGTFLVTNSFIDVGDIEIEKKVSGRAATVGFNLTMVIKDTSGKFDFTDNDFYSKATIPSGVTLVSRTASELKYSFVLTDGQKLSFKDIVPDGAQVTVTESNYGIYSPKIKVNNDTGVNGATRTFKVEGISKTSVLVENTTASIADLSVEKALGTGTETTKEYSFTLTIEDTAGLANFTDTTGYMKDAVYTGATVSSKTKSKIVFTFKLSGGNKIDFKNFVPEKAKITLVETDHKNCNVVMKYNGTQIGTDSGTVNSFSTAGGAFVVTNSFIDVGDIEIQKKVSGKTTAEAFNLTMVIKDKSGKFDFTDNDFYSKATIPSGATLVSRTASELKYSFSLKDGEKLSFLKIVPDGAEVTVTETDYGEYSPKIIVNSDSGVDGSTRTFTVEEIRKTSVLVENTAAATGDLSVEKALGTGTTTSKEYSFTLTIEDTVGLADFTDTTGYMKDAKFNGATISSQEKSKIVFTFKLKGGDKIDFKNFVPDKAKITLVETDHKNCNVVMKYNGTEIGTDSGTVNDFSTEGGTLLVTNTFIDVGNIEIEKKVSGKATTEAFNLTMVIKDTSGKFDFTDNDFYSKATIPPEATLLSQTESELKYSFSLKDGEKLSFLKIVPAGAEVTITETDYGEYSPKIIVNNDEGEDGATRTFIVQGINGTSVLVENTAEGGGALPETGGSGTTMFIAGGVLLLALSLAYGLLLMYRRERGYRG